MNDPLTRLSLELPTDGQVRRFWKEANRARHDPAAGTRLLESGREPTGGSTPEDGPRTPVLLSSPRPPLRRGTSRPARFRRRTYLGVGFFMVCCLAVAALLLLGNG